MNIHIDHMLESQVALLAAQMGQTSDMFVQEAIRNHLEEVADALKARTVSASNEPLWTQEEIERDLGFRS